MKAFCNIQFLNITAFIAIVIPLSFSESISGQEIRVEKISASTRIYDELAPVYYRNGIVFCTNRRTNSLIGYSNADTRPFKLFYSEENSSGRWKLPILFSKEITGTFNEGPATFDRKGESIYFTRNNSVSGRFSNVNDASEKLGIYSAEMINGFWQNIQAFKHNNPDYTFATPSLSFDGQRLFFSSDKPGGFGGMDIYYCDKCGNGWCDPVNAGEGINSKGNETYPFIDRAGRLWFASDGWPGLGGKDIFYAFEADGEWMKAVSADSLINSATDDYGIVVDSTGLNGYFTSNRHSSEDIFRFTTILPEFTDCDTFSEPPFCFTIYDERYSPNDTLDLVYEWNFGNGIIKKGHQVKHCFPGPGEYTISLDITDRITGDTIAWKVEYPVSLDRPDQLFVQAPDISIAGKEIAFNTNGSILAGSDVMNYSWNFGEGFKSGLFFMEHKFMDPGSYTVTVGMKNEYGIGCVSREIRILNSVKEISRIENVDQTRVTLLSDVDIPSAVLAAFDKKAKDPKVTIDENGIHEKTSMWLEYLASLLKEYHLHLDIQVYNAGDRQKAVQDSRELEYFLKDHLDQNQFNVHAAELKNILGEDKSTARIVYEFIITR